MKEYYLDYKSKAGVVTLSLVRQMRFRFVKVIISREIELDAIAIFKLKDYLEFNDDDEAELWFRLNY